MQKKKKK